MVGVFRFPLLLGKRGSGDRARVWCSLSAHGPPEELPGSSVVSLLLSSISECPVSAPGGLECMVFLVGRWLAPSGAPWETWKWRWGSWLVLPVGARARWRAWDRRWCRWTTIGLQHSERQHHFSLTKYDPMLWPRRSGSLRRGGRREGVRERGWSLASWTEHIGSKRALSTDSGAGTCGVTARSERFPCLVTRKLASDPGLLKHRKCE